MINPRSHDCRIARSHDYREFSSFLHIYLLFLHPECIIVLVVNKLIIFYSNRKKQQNIMKSFLKIFSLFIILAFTGAVSSAQTVTAPNDTIKASQQQIQNQEKKQAKDINGNNGQRQANNQGNSGKKAVKQVKSARPDMSKAKGARPNITRPSGSGIPKGVGKPGGVGKHIGR